MEANHEYKLVVTNKLKIPIMYILGISGEENKIQKDESHEIPMASDGILNMWLNPGSAELTEKIPYTVKEEVSPNGPGGNHTIQVIRHYGKPPGAEQETPIWKIFWGSLSPTTPRGGPSIRQHVNVTIGEPG